MTATIAMIFINLDRASDRRAFMEAQGERLGLSLERFPAVSSDDVDDATVASIGRSWERPLTRPEIGCFLSHRSLWARIAAGDGPVLVMEDDVALSPRLPRLLPTIAGLGRCDVLNLEDFARKRFVGARSLPLVEGLSLVRVFRDKAGAAAYVLWPSGARQLLSRAEAMGAAPADAFLHAAGLLSYQAEPALAIQAEVLARRGARMEFQPQTSIQAPRRRLSPTPSNLPFIARRVTAQVKLLRFHAARLAGLSYRRIDVDPADFAVSPDQSRS